MTTAPTSAITSPIGGDDDVPHRPAPRLVEQHRADDDADDRIDRRHGGDSRSQAAGAERHLLQHEPEDAGDRKDVRLPVGQHRRHALAEVRECRLGECGRQSEQQSRHGPVHGGARARVSTVATPEVQQHRRGDHDEHDHDGPFRVRCVVVAARRIGEQGEQGEPAHDHRRPDDLLRPDVLSRQPVPEREGEHHGRDQERLHDGQPAVVEGDRLGDIAAQERDRAEQPPPLAEQLQQRRGVGERHLREMERSFLLQCRRHREQERGEQCKGRVHRARTLGADPWTIGDPRRPSRSMAEVVPAVDGGGSRRFVSVRGGSGGGRPLT